MLVLYLWNMSWALSAFVGFCFQGPTVKTLWRLPTGSWNHSACSYRVRHAEHLCSPRDQLANDWLWEKEIPELPFWARWGCITWPEIILAWCPSFLYIASLLPHWLLGCGGRVLLPSEITTALWKYDLKQSWFTSVHLSFFRGGTFFLR